MKSSDTSAKYSWPRSEQKEDIQDSEAPEEEDMMDRLVRVPEAVEVPVGETTFRSSRAATNDESSRIDSLRAGMVLVLGVDRAVGLETSFNNFQEGIPLVRRIFGKDTTISSPSLFVCMLARSSPVAALR